jgi:CRP-like cAMP-binding protein
VCGCVLTLLCNEDSVFQCIIIHNLKVIRFSFLIKFQVQDLYNSINRSQNMMNDEDEPYMSPRQLWLYSGKLILEALRLVRSQTMSGRRFDALLQMARMNKKSLEDGSFNAAVANTPKVPRKNDDEKESLPEKVSLNLLSGATRIVRRVEPGSRDDVQLALIMSAFPLLKEIHNDKTAKNLCQAMKIRTVPAQTVLLERGTVGKDFVALLSGTIRLMVTTSNIIVEEKEEVIVMCEEEEEDGSENEDSEDSEEEGGGRKEEEKQNEKTRSINRPNGIHISTLKPGDLILRTARAIHLFESLSFGFTGRDGTDEEMVTVAYIDSTTYSNILFESKVIASVAFTKAAVQKRRQNLRDATKASRKLKEERKVKTEENLVTPPTEFLIPTLTDCDRIRILMNKVPDRRSVEEIEFLIHYLDRFDYWNKLSVIKSHDDDAENYANRGGTSKKINKEKAINGLTSRLQREIVRHLSTLIYNKKEVIYEENDISEMYFFILKGSVVIRKRYGLNNTQSKTIHTLTSGSSFGENGLTKYSMMGGKEENHNYATTTSVTYENCEFLILSKSECKLCVFSFLTA